jgi:hypothetical protein
LRQISTDGATIFAIIMGLLSMEGTELSVGKFPVHPMLLEIMSYVSRHVRSGEPARPSLSAVGHQLYLEVHNVAGNIEEGEVSWSRSLELKNLPPDARESIQQQLDLVDFEQCQTNGLSVGLAQVTDNDTKSILHELLTFLNLRQQKILFHLYQKAFSLETGPQVTIDTNDLMEALEYKKGNDGYFYSSDRERVCQDLSILESVRITYGAPVVTEKGVIADIKRINLIAIKGYQRSKADDPNFGWKEALRFDSDLPSKITIRLEHWATREEDENYVLISNDIDVSHIDGRGRREDYRFRLLVYIASRMHKKGLIDNRFLRLSKYYTFKFMGLFGKNDSRNNTYFQAAAKQLIEEGFLRSWKEVQADRQQYFEFEINHSKLSLSVKKTASRRKAITSTSTTVVG